MNYSSIADAVTPEIKKLKHISPKSILFVGNSYLYYNDSLHNHFKRIVEEKNPNYDGSSNVKSSTIGGSRLKHIFVIDLFLNYQPAALNLGYFAYLPLSKLNQGS